LTKVSEITKRHRWGWHWFNRTIMHETRCRSSNFKID